MGEGGWHDFYSQADKMQLRIDINRISKHINVSINLSGTNIFNHLCILGDHRKKTRLSIS